MTASDGNDSMKQKRKEEKWKRGHGVERRHSQAAGHNDWVTPRSHHSLMDKRWAGEVGIVKCSCAKMS